MRIQYKVNKSNHNIYIRNDIDECITKEINKNQSDKKILLIYDDKINKTNVDKIIKLLKNTGCDVSAFNFKGKKRNKKK